MAGKNKRELGKQVARATGILAAFWSSLISRSTITADTAYALVVHNGKSGCGFITASVAFVLYSVPTTTNPVHLKFT